MPITFTNKDLRAALGFHPNTVYSWTKDLPRSSPEGRYPLSFDVVHVLPRLTHSQACNLLPRCESDNGLWVGDEGTIMPACRRLSDWFETDEGMSRRVAQVRATFFNSLSGTPSGAIAADAERVRQLLPVSCYTLPYIVTGDTADLPTAEGWPSFARAFALVHSSMPAYGEVLAA